jgi:signal transduction histidine kinase
MNLARNAIKFTGEGKCLSGFFCEKLTRKNVFLRFEVSDSGIGIPKEDLDTIFDEFSHSRQNQNPENSKGIGLGLTIVKKLVELLNGRIHVESTPGEGSIFTVVLPLKGHIPQKKNS